MRLGLVFGLVLGSVGYARTAPLETLRAQCPGFPGVEREDVRECRVSEFAGFGSVDGRTYYYALYCLIPREPAQNPQCGEDAFLAKYHSRRALAVFVGDGRSAELLFARASSEIGVLRYEPPEFVRMGTATVLRLPVILDGTANVDESEYFVRDRGGWQALETQAWITDLSKRLPAGLGLGKGIRPDLPTLSAEADLYRPEDANCCPTGGRVRAILAVRGGGLVLEGVEVERSR